MSFGGTFGPAGNLVPFGIIQNLEGESSPGYDAAGRIMFARKSGSIYTPDRVDTLIMFGDKDGSNPLDKLTPDGMIGGTPDIGTLVSAVPQVFLGQHGLPTNFGPGRDKWGSVAPVSQIGSFAYGRFRIQAEPVIAVSSEQGGPAPVACQGSVMINSTVSSDPNNVYGVVRNYFGVPVPSLILIVECLHSAQG